MDGIIRAYFHLTIYYGQIKVEDAYKWDVQDVLRYTRIIQMMQVLWPLPWYSAKMT
jgi:hypothetical protein